MKHLIKVLTASAILSLAVSNIAFAKEDREKIAKVELDIQYDITDDTVNLDVSTSSGNYSVDDYELVNEPSGEDGWDRYDTPRVTIYVSTDDNYYFSSVNKSYFKFSGMDVSFVDAKRDSDKSELEVTLDLVPVNGSIGNPSNLRWSSRGVASWDKAYKAKKYEIRISRNDSTISSGELTTTATSFDLVKYINNTGNYRFKVRAINSNYTSNWVESSEWAVTDEILKTLDTVWEEQKQQGASGPSADEYWSPGKIKGTTGWIQDSTGWWYRNLDGGYTTNNWQFIDNKWYYFDNVGYMRTGWLQLGDKWYYLNTSGDMATGWINLNDKWYCLKADGSMYSNTTTPDGYKVNASGEWIH